MEDKFVVDPPIAAMAIKLVQPGLLGDVVEGIKRLAPDTHQSVDKEIVSTSIARLISEGLVEIYSKRRYMLTDLGESLVQATGVRYQLDIRRMFLLRETRRSNIRARSDTRDRSLKQ